MGKLVLWTMAGGAALAVLVIVSSGPAATETAEELFTKNCGACHALNATDAPRQGPVLNGIVGRKAGKVEGFPYSAGLKSADFTWDETMLDKWITEPRDLIPDTYMIYKQADPAVRSAIINYLKIRN